MVCRASQARPEGGGGEVMGFFLTFPLQIYTFFLQIRIRLKKAGSDQILTCNTVCEEGNNRHLIVVGAGSSAATVAGAALRRGAERLQEQAEGGQELQPQACQL